MQLKVIAYAQNGHTDKFGIPRQSREDSPILTRIVFEPDYQVKEALRGIEGYSHLWLLWGFSEVEQSPIKVSKNSEQSLTWSPTVRPPRLGGNKRMGVFATRSPFRPNPIGLSSVRLLGVRSQESGSKTLELLVSGADVLDGTPIYDIKPYLSFSDCHEDAKNGFAEDAKDYRLEVDWSESGLITNESLTNHQLITNESPVNHPSITRESPANHPRLDSKWVEDVSYILSQDPRPGYQDDPTREYKLDYCGYTVTFVVQKSTAIVKKIEKI